MDIFSLAIIGTLLGGIIIILKKGFNEIVKGLESIDERIKRLEELNSQDKKHDGTTMANNT